MRSFLNFALEKPNKYHIYDNKSKNCTAFFLLNGYAD